MVSTRRTARACLGALLLATAAGCVKEPPKPTLPFAFDARPTWGEVRVLPVLAVHDQVPLNLESYAGPPLTEPRERTRRLRTWELEHQVPAEVAWALPGELNGALGDAWGGQFLTHHYPPGVRERLRSALAGERDLDQALGELGRTVGGNATLLCWVREVTGEPLSTRGFPGEVVETGAGTVVLDHDDEPYLITARVGMALVAHDGEVVLRYEDSFSTLLSSRQPPVLAGRALASKLADEVVTVWAIDPRLFEHEPEAPQTATHTLQPAPDLGPTAFRPTLQ